MARRRKQSAPAAQTPAPDARQHKMERVPFSWLKPAPYNARRVTRAELHAICASVVRFGLVDPFVVRGEDGLLIAGHQRREAVQYILDGKYTVDAEGRYAEGGKAATLEMPEGKVWAVVVRGLNDRDTKRLNLALNRVGGSWDDDKLADLMRDLTQGGFDDLVVTGFDREEINKMLAGDQPGQVPAPAGRVPKITLEFSSKETRDAVKAAIAGKTKAGELSGDALGRWLIKPKKAE